MYFKVLGVVLACLGMFALVDLYRVYRQPRPEGSRFKVYVPNGAEIYHASQVEVTPQTKVVIPFDEFKRKASEGSSKVIVTYQPPVWTGSGPVYTYWLTRGDGVFYTAEHRLHPVSLRGRYSVWWRQLDRATWEVVSEDNWSFPVIYVFLAGVAFSFAWLLWKLGSRLSQKHAVTAPA